MKLADVFTDHMVLQRGRPIHLWGTGKGKVHAEVAGVDSRAWSYDGEWHLILPELPVGGPYELVVTDEEETLVFRDVLVGDVWLASGQSNMEHPLFLVENGFEDAAKGADRQIRFFRQPRRSFVGQTGIGGCFEPELLDHTAWQVCTEDTALHTSAIGFHFARLMRQAENVPIGILNCNYGGTNIEAWIPRDRLFSDPRLETLRRNHVEWFAQLDMEDHRQRIEALRQERADAFKGKDLPAMVKELGPAAYNRMDLCVPVTQITGGPYHCSWAGVLFDTMIRPLAPYSIRGVLWYQGENNTDWYPDVYDVMMRHLVRSWRWAFDDEALPFLTVQIAPWEHPKPNMNFPVVERQIRAAKEIPGVAIITTADLGEADNIHPIRKAEFARRLFLAARNRVFGEPCEYSGPIAERAELREQRLIVSFSHADGLTFRERGSVILEDASGSAFEAEASAEGNCIAVKVPSGFSPVRVKMGTENVPHIVLFNSAGFPAAPFCLPVLLTE